MPRLLFSLLLTVALTTPAVAAGFDHGPFDALLQKHVHGEKVDYTGFVNNPAFEAYVQAIGQTDPKSVGGPKARLAFWINAYNALTIHGVVQHWPNISSVLKVKPDFFKTKNKVVGGKTLSLNDIENSIIRPRFKDPRIHAALNCASISCPPLARRAFTAGRLDAQLDRVMRTFIRDSSRNQITANGLKVSEIFNWYKQDFEPAGGVAAYLAKYLDGEQKAHALKATSIGHLPYNWQLNKR